MRRIGTKHALLMCALALTTACGRQESVGEQEQATGVDNGVCSEALLGTGSVATATCAGPWEYGRYVTPCVQSNPACGISGYQQKTCYPTCRNIAFGVDPSVAPTSYTVSGTWVPDVACRRVRVCELVCSGPIPLAPGGCRNVCTYEEVCDVPTTRCDTATVVAAEKAKYGTYAAQITVATNATACTATLSNVPTFALGSSAVCGAGWSCNDTTRPIYAACEVGQLGVCGLATATQFSGPNQTYAQVQAADGYAVPAAVRAPRCTTADDLPMSTPAQVGAKHVALWNEFSTATGARAKDAALPDKLIKNMKLLLELRGESLTPAQRQQDYWLVQTRPDVRHACGVSWTRPPETTINQAWDFESPAAPFPGWDVQGPVTAAGGAGNVRSGAYAALLGNGLTGDSQVSHRFTAPSAGGKLSFWYKVACADTVANDYASAWLGDDTLGQAWQILPNVCNNLGSWTQVIVDLTPWRGHALTLVLKNHENGLAPTTTTLYDEVRIDAIPREFEAMLDTCGRLGNVGANGLVGPIANHVSRQTAEALVAECLWEGEKVTGLLPAGYPTKDQYATQFNTCILGMFGRYMDRVEPAGATGMWAPAQRIPVLRQRLQMLQVWFKYLKDPQFYPAADAADRRFADSSRGLKLFWQGARATPLDMLSTLNGAGQAASFSADRQVLLAAFPESGAVPMADAPLLLLMNDALRPLSNRLEEVDRFHDLGCTFRGCANGFNDELSQLHRMLARLDDSAALGLAVDGASAVRTDTASVDPWKDDWNNALGRVRSRYADAVVPAVRDAFVLPTGDVNVLMTQVFTTGTKFALDLASLIRDNRRKTDNYARSGLFVAPTRAWLAIGLQKAKQADVETELTLRRNALLSEINAYESGRATLVSNLVAEYGNTRQQQSVLDRLNVQAKQIENQSQELVALRLNAEVEAARLADFGKAYDGAVARFLTDPTNANFVVQPGTPMADTMVTPAAASKFKGARPYTINSIQVDGWKVTAAAGDTLNLDITGQWAPSCALTTKGKIGGKNIAVAGALTGPQGYEVRFSSDTYNAQSHATTDDSGHYSNYNATAKACVGMRISQDAGIVGDIFGCNAEVYASTEACVGADWGTRSSHTTADSTSNGSDTRSSAAFAAGLRLDNTPFPEFPAGSLLLLRMAPGKANLVRGELLDVQVLQPATSVVVDKAADFYLVANELGTCTPDPRALTVKSKLLHPFGQAAVSFGRAMASARQTLQASAAAFLQAGATQVSATELQSLRDRAMNELSVQCACQASSYPEAITGFYGAWVSSELARVEREVQIRNLERQMEVAYLELAGMNNEIAGLRTESRFLKLLPAWQLASLDAERLRSSTSDLVYAVGSWVYPFVNVRYPETIAALEQDAYSRGLLDQLQTVQWDGPVNTTARLAYDFGNQVMVKLKNVTLASQLTGYTYPVAVSFPNPYFVPSPFAPPPANPYKKVDEVRARQVWDAIAQRKSVSLTIRPEDLYSRAGGAAQLVCTKSVPIIQSMSVFLSRSGPENDSLNAYSWTVPLLTSPELAFSAVPGALDMQFTNPSWLTGQVRMLFGEPAQAVDKFHTLAASTPVLAGLSPVSSFEFDMSSFGVLPFDPFTPDSAQSLIVVMDVDPRDVAAPGLAWPATCK